jgi:hypothetical protein
MSLKTIFNNDKKKPSPIVNSDKEATKSGRRTKLGKFADPRYKLNINVYIIPTIAVTCAVKTSLTGIKWEGNVKFKIICLFEAIEADADVSPELKAIKGTKPEKICKVYFNGSLSPGT